MENGQKTLRPLEEGLRKPLPWPKKKKYDSHMKVDIIPLNPRILPVVLASTKTFSVGITKVIMKKLLVHRDLSFLS